MADFDQKKDRFGEKIRQNTLKNKHLTTNMK